jgi:hypothetical protein
MKLIRPLSTALPFGWAPAFPLASQLRWREKGEPEGPTIVGQKTSEFRYAQSFPFLPVSLRTYEGESGYPKGEG